MTLNGGFDYIERLGPDADGATVLEYLARRWRHSSRESWAARIESGRVRVGGRVVDGQQILRSGETLVWSRPPWSEPEVPAALEVLYEDGDVLALGKPAGLPTLPGAGYLHATLLHRARERVPDAAPVHRLGRWTSGVVLLGCNPAARAGLASQLAARTVVKRYRALASGDPTTEAFTVTAAIGRVPHRFLGGIHAASLAGRPASSEVAVLERRGGAFLCDVRIATGRPHQIRIHLASAGHPLVGDPLYSAGGTVAPDCEALPGDPGYRLHAAEIAFRHPRDGRAMAIACEPPPDLRPERGLPSFRFDP